MLKPLKISLTGQRLIIAAAIFLVSAGNFRFFIEAEKAFPFSENFLFLVSLAFVLTAVIILLILPFNTRYTLKPLLLILVFVSASASYFADNFSTVIDESMLRNMLATDTSEAADLLTTGFIIQMILFGLVPAVVIYKLPLIRRSVRTEVIANLKLTAGALAVIVISIAINGAQYASFFREYKPIRYYTTPVYPVYSAVRMAIHAGESAPLSELKHLYPDAHVPAGDPHRELMILVIGETARADHFSLYGYERDTTPILSAMDSLYVFEDVSSCGTSTAVSVPCIFSQFHREDFSLDAANRQENLLDVLQHAGVHVLWRDNNSSSKGVADRVPYQNFRDPAINPVCDIECRDVGMLHNLQQYIDQQTGDILIVLHQMGSHGPAYYKRVPAEYAKFQPSCQSNVLSKCSAEEIINSYDNTIYYTDWFLGQVVELLKQNQDAFEAAMFYVSDHGESLGEQGLYLHGFPYMFAPEAQTHVPMVLWLGEHNDINEFILSEEIHQKASHDILWSTLLTYFELNISEQDRESSEFTLDEK
jgi:lipid A ethanolaminephosphotransferase